MPKKLNCSVDVKFKTGLVEYWEKCKDGGQEQKYLPKEKVGVFIKKLDPKLFSFQIGGGDGGTAEIPFRDMLPGSIIEISPNGEGGLDVAIKGEVNYEFLPRQADPFVKQKKALVIRVRAFSYFTGGIVDALGMSGITAWVKGYRETRDENAALALLPVISKWKIK